MDAILSGLLNCFDPLVIVTLFASVFLGVVIGALPGFGAATGLVILLPFTYHVSPRIALVALVGVYMGAEYGGSISSILLNTPGTGGAVVTCLDGFPLAQQGKAREALLISNIASFFGGIVGGCIMLLFLPLLAKFAFLFGAGEIFLLAVLGLTLVGSLTKGSTVKGIASVAFGILLAMVGTDAVSGVARFYFGQPFLISELPMIPVMLGLFSVPYLLKNATEKQTQRHQITFGAVNIKSNLHLFREIFCLLFRKMKRLLLRSSLIGTIVGVIPGVGGAVATFLSYTIAKGTSKASDTFGQGSYEGVAAPEATNNGIVGGSLIPVLSLGIPGSPAAAVFMSAIFMQGMIPGPKFMAEQAPLVYTIVIAVLLAAMVQLFYGAFTIGFLSNILKIPVYYLVPSTVIICCIGAYAVRGLNFDICLFILFGLIGFFLMKLDFQLAAVILGFILGSTLEISLIEAITISSAKAGLLHYFLARPISIAIFCILLFYLGYSLLQTYKQRKTSKAKASSKNKGFKGMRLYDLLIALLGLGGCGFLYWSEVRHFPKLVGLFPSMALFVIVICCVLLLYQSLRNGGYTEKDSSPFRGVIRERFLVMIGMIVLYTFGVIQVGFFISSFLFAFWGTRYLHAKEAGALSTKQNAMHLAYALFFHLVVYLIFVEAFALDLPAKLIL